jgi:hypothetical protein
MQPLSGRIYLAGDSKLNAINVGIQLHDGEEAAIINLDIVAQLEPIAIPDFLVHRFKFAIAANWYPDLTEALQTGRLRADTDLTLSEASKQWTDLGLTQDALNMDIEAALSRFTETVTVAASQTQSDILADMQQQMAEMRAQMANPVVAAPPIDQSEIIAQQAAELAELKAMLAAQQSAPKPEATPPPATPAPLKVRPQVAL